MRLQLSRLVPALLLLSIAPLLYRMAVPVALKSTRGTGMLRDRARRSEGDGHSHVGHVHAFDDQDPELRQSPVLMSDPDEERQREDLFIGVLTDPKSLRTLGMAAYATWIRDMQPYASVYFFIGSCTSSVTGFPGEIICLDTPDTYPPQRKVFLMWQHMYQNYGSQFTWFMKVDHDSYVNVMRIRELLRELKIGPYRFKRSYLGLPASGRKGELDQLGLNGKRYCSGLGYIMNAPAVHAIGDRLMECLGNIVSNHSDTEIGRCVFHHAGAQCSAIPRFQFKQVYYQQAGTRVFPMKLIAGGQMKLTFPQEPKATHFAAVLIHPLKRAEDFYRFHKQTMSSLRPVQPLISTDSQRSSYRQAIMDLKQTCVNNPVTQLEVGRFFLKECGTPQAQHAPDIPAEAAVLTRPGPTGEELFRETQASLAESGIRARRVDLPRWRGGATGEELTDYLAAMRSLFRNASVSGVHRLFVLEDKVMFICDFKNELWQLLNNPRCGGHLYTELQGGVLVLGADEVTPEGLAKIESDRSLAFSENNHNVKAAMCYNVHSQLTGSFGAIYHRSVFSAVLEWLDSLEREGATVPFHKLFQHLSRTGYIVRAAFPNLVLRHIPKEPLSALNVPGHQVAVHLRWYEEKYCRRGGLSWTKR